VHAGKIMREYIVAEQPNLQKLIENKAQFSFVRTAEMYI
jgi:hypothetical protein